MVNNSSPNDPAGPSMALASICEQLTQTVADVAASARNQGADVTNTVALIRRIQRLADAAIVELADAAERSDSSPPLETVLAGDGSVPRPQVQTEIERWRTAQAFPGLADAHRNGDVPTANLDTLARCTQSLSEQDLDGLAVHDDKIAETAGRLNNDSFRRRITRLRTRVRADHGVSAAQQVVDDSFARITPTPERDAYRLGSTYDPLRGAAISAALNREAKYLTEHPDLCVGMTPTQVAAQALHDLILRGDASDHTSLPRASVQISVLADRDTLATGPHDDTIAENNDGLPINPLALGRLCCDATLRRIDTAADGDVHVSRSARTPSPAQRAALRALYPACPISGAGWESIEIHHVIYYEQSQRTVLSELVPISRRWHHLIHDQGWQLTMDPDRTLHLSRPDGTPFRTIDPPTPINQAAKSDHDLAA